MKEIDPHTCRIETLIGALLYLMTAYQRNRRRDVALSITAHLNCLARHPDATDIVRQIARGLAGDWTHAAHAPASLGEMGASRPARLN